MSVVCVLSCSICVYTTYSIQCTVVSILYCILSNHISLFQTAASGAVLKLNESLLEGRTISVAISNPPKKGRSTVAMETSGAGRKEMPPPRLIPTAV